MALTLRSGRRESSEHHPWPTAEMKLLAELEQHRGGRPKNTAGEPRPAATTGQNAEIGRAHQLGAGAAVTDA